MALTLKHILVPKYLCKFLSQHQHKKTESVLQRGLIHKFPNQTRVFLKKIRCPYFQREITNFLEKKSGGTDMFCCRGTGIRQCKQHQQTPSVIVISLVGHTIKHLRGLSWSLCSVANKDIHQKSTGFPALAHGWLHSGVKGYNCIGKQPHYKSSKGRDFVINREYQRQMRNKKVKSPLQCHHIRD